MNKDKAIAEINKAKGVLTAMYAFLRDMVIMDRVDADKDGQLGAVVAAALTGLNSLLEMLTEDDPHDDDLR